MATPWKGRDAEDHASLGRFHALSATHQQVCERGADARQACGRASFRQERSVELGCAWHQTTRHRDLKCKRPKKRSSAACMQVDNAIREHRGCITRADGQRQASLVPGEHPNTTLSELISCDAFRSYENSLSDLECTPLVQMYHRMVLPKPSLPNKIHTRAWLDWQT